MTVNAGSLEVDKPHAMCIDPEATWRYIDEECVGCGGECVIAIGSIQYGYTAEKRKLFSFRKGDVHRHVVCDSGMCQYVKQRVGEIGYCKPGHIARSIEHALNTETGLLERPELQIEQSRKVSSTGPETIETVVFTTRIPESYVRDVKRRIHLPNNLTIADRGRYSLVYYESETDAFAKRVLKRTDQIDSIINEIMPELNSRGMIAVTPYGLTVYTYEVNETCQSLIYGNKLVKWKDLGMRIPDRIGLAKALGIAVAEKEPNQCYVLDFAYDDGAYCAVLINPDATNVVREPQLEDW